MKIKKAPNLRLMFIILFVCVCLISSTSYLARSLYNHAGFFGLGIPSPKTEYSFADYGLTIEYPGNWRIVLTPGGNHGDGAVFALIGIPWHSIPNITMARENSYGEILSVVQWGEMRTRLSTSYQTVSLSAFDSEYFPAMLREYTYTVETPFAITEIRCQDYYILYSQTGYSFSFCAEQNNWSEVLGTFSEIIHSIRPTK
jgi:hypothetical protein